MIIRMDDITRCGFCASGARRWFGAHGLDFRSFMKDGIPAETFLATGDALAQRVVDSKMTRERADG